VIVGGGPTGVEFAAELHDLIHDDLLNLYPHLHNDVKITVVQSGDHILNTYDERISKYAEQKFTREGIDVKMGCRVLGVQEGDIAFKVKSTSQLVNLPYGMIVWSTGTNFFLSKEAFPSTSTCLIQKGHITIQPVPPYFLSLPLVQVSGFNLKPFWLCYN
jgi:pyruvate/2-oxoglutarate dehydrogenase complex dihydrolipoamide dehydrogenase (E3) component